MMQKLIQAANETRVKLAIIGDGLLDVYVHGRLESGQDDCPKFVEETRVVVDGGAANAARSLSHWNAEVRLWSGQRPTKTRYVVNGKYVFRADYDNVVPTQHEKRVACLHEVMAFNPAALLISDYDKGFMDESLIRTLIKYAKKMGIPVVADAKRHSDIYLGAIIKCNYAYTQSSTWAQAIIS